MARRGRRAELAAEALQRVLFDNPYPLIESPGFLTDKVTDRKREFDVLVTGNSVVETIEVRDRAEVVGVGEIEAFVTKVQDTNADGATFISTRGFGGPALIKARHYGITCFRMRVSDRNHWGHRPEVQVRMAKPVPNSAFGIEYLVGDETNLEVVHESKIVTSLGEPPDQTSILRSAMAAINGEGGRRLERSGRANVTVPLCPKGLFALRDECNGRLELERIRVHLKVDIIADKFYPTVFGLYAIEASVDAPEAELVVYPEVAKILGVDAGSVGFGTRPGGPLKMLIMREPEITGVPGDGSNETENDE